MSCGGIEIAKPDWEGLPKDQVHCNHCGRRMRDATYVYFCEEADKWIHKECIHEWLATSSVGEFVLGHKHQIHILEEGGGEG